MEEVGEFKQASRGKDQKHKEEELGDVLMAIVNVARFEGIDPEAALHAGVKKLTKRIEGVERGAERRGKKISELKEKDILALWREVKVGEKIAKKR
jgi:uncharacterized protein YabN with tetrapyrrole methylase and pyrophosphatase domain